MVVVIAPVPLIFQANVFRVIFPRCIGFASDAVRVGSRVRR
jgi:hypothetical protein